MSFKNEVRWFMNSVDNWMKKVAVGTKVYQDIIDRQEQMIKDLADKLLARDLPELKTYTIQHLPQKEEKYNPADDEDLAGTIYMGPEKKNGDAADVL